jgi:hypothetical protein
MQPKCRRARSAGAIERQMKSKPPISRTVLALSLSSALCLAAPFAHAQVGSGWTQFHPDSNLQIEVHDKYIEYSGTTTSISNGGVRYSNSGGIETFQLVSTASNRVERRYKDNYSSRRQFEGYVKVYSPSDDEKVHQIFCATPDGPYLLVGEFASSSGSLRVLAPQGSATVATGIYGVWVRLNSIHDHSANATSIYINGSKKWSNNWGSGSSYYTKYGCYGTLKTSSAKIQYKNVKMFK